MKMSTILGISLVMAAAVPPAAAHICASEPAFPPACGPCPPGENHDHVDVNADGSISECRSIPRGHPACPSEPVHTYGTSGGGGVGVVYVTDTNEEDCDGDGIGGDWDGDYDAGVGGGAFGWGPWADEPVCNNGLNVHGPNVVVNDVVFGGAITFVIGEDDQAGPVIIQDPGTGLTVCETDGNISPGDPWTDPTADADDCLSVQYTTTGTTCGSGGGDGLFWVFLGPRPCPIVLDREVCRAVGGVVDVLCPPINQNNCDRVKRITGTDAASGSGNPPTSGTITAF